jgi:hypothetical protein
MNQAWRVQRRGNQKAKMYSIDLAQITLDEFAEILTTIDLLPGRRILLDNLSGVIERLKRKEIGHLAALQRALKNKKQYPQLAKELAVSAEYLVILNREINGYVSKPVPLAKLDVYSEAEIKQLEEAGLKSTRDLYEHCLTKRMRQELSERSGLSENRLIEGFELAELVRINGVGPVYAKILREMGIRNAADYLKMGSEALLKNYEKVNEEKAYTKARLGIKDIEYCKRFCSKLAVEIKW